MIVSLITITDQPELRETHKLHPLRLSASEFWQIFVEKACYMSEWADIWFNSYVCFEKKDGRKFLCTLLMQRTQF